MMLGYLHKDCSQPHFRVALHNIDEAEIEQGIAEWRSMKLSYVRSAHRQLWACGRGRGLGVLHRAHSSSCLHFIARR